MVALNLKEISKYYDSLQTDILQNKYEANFYFFFQFGSGVKVYIWVLYTFVAIYRMERITVFTTCFIRALKGTLDEIHHFLKMKGMVLLQTAM